MSKNNRTDCNGKNVLKPSTSHRCYKKTSASHRYQKLTIAEVYVKVLGVAMLLVGMVIFVLVAVLLHEKENENGEEGFNEIRLDCLQRPSGPWT